MLNVWSSVEDFPKMTVDIFKKPLSIPINFFSRPSRPEERCVKSSNPPTRFLHKCHHVRLTQSHHMIAESWHPLLWKSIFAELTVSMSAFPLTLIYLPLWPPWHTSTFAEITISSIPNCILLGTVFHQPDPGSTNRLPGSDTDADWHRLRGKETICKWTIYFLQKFSCIYRCFY